MIPRISGSRGCCIKEDTREIVFANSFCREHSFAVISIRKIIFLPENFKFVFIVSLFLETSYKQFKAR